MKNTLSNWNKVLGSLAALMAGVGMLVLASSGPASAAGAGAGIVNSPHDFAASSWNFRGEICRVCHVPHDHNRNETIFTEGLLWNHALSSATYEMYSSFDLQGAQDGQPTGVAKLCLGCHDGTVAIDSFDKQAPTLAGTVFIGTFAGGDFQHPGADIPLVGGTKIDLRGTHPISIVYDETLDTNLQPKTATMGTSGTIADVLDGGKVQCSSCHDVHDQESVASTHLLRVGQKNSQGGATPSQLCLTCHIK